MFSQMLSDQASCSNKVGFSSSQLMLHVKTGINILVEPLLVFGFQTRDSQWAKAGKFCMQIGVTAC